MLIETHFDYFSRAEKPFLSTESKKKITRKWKCIWNRTKNEDTRVQSILSLTNCWCSEGCSALVPLSVKI